jgi:hypothetical protein
MKRLLIILIASLTLSSCDIIDDYIGIDRERFVDTYTEILIIRETYPDTTVANKMVRDVYGKYDYTEEDFRDDYFELFKNDKDEFLQLMDSARTLAKKRLTEKNDSGKKED